MPPKVVCGKDVVCVSLWSSEKTLDPDLNVADRKRYWSSRVCGRRDASGRMSVMHRTSLKIQLRLRIPRHHATAVGAAGVHAGLFGGGISLWSDSLRFLPFGGGPKGGDRRYVTVLVTTDLTLTGRLQPVRGASKKYLLPEPSNPQSAGENGDRALKALRVVAVLGEGLMVEENAGECGILSLLRACVDVADSGLPVGDEGVMAIDGDRWSRLWLDEKLVAVDGTEDGVSRPDDSSEASTFVTALGSALDGAGLFRTGVRALRNSVYATGGVMGVFNDSSCLTMADRHGKGLALARISDGKEADLGV